MQHNQKKIEKVKKYLVLSAPVLLALVSAYASPDAGAASGGGGDTTFGSMAGNLNSQFGNIGKLMINTAYLAGLGFGISAVFKFKQHKDNPQQIPIGTPFALLAISILLVFLPAIYKPAAQSIYGTSSGLVGSDAASGLGLSAVSASQ